MKPDLIITKHNALVEASYRLSLEEQRLILACIAQINPTDTTGIPRTITVSAKSYAAIYGLDVNNTYTQLKDATDGLYKRDIKIKNHKNQTLGRTRWVQSVFYNKSEGSVTLNFSDYVRPYLGQLNGLFKSYQLNNVASLKSTYSIRLYELLNQWKDTGKRFITLDDFHQTLKTGDIYDRYTDLRRCVIEPAIKELNKKTNFTVLYYPKKKGRKVVSLEFCFTVNDKPVKVERLSL